MANVILEVMGSYPESTVWNRQLRHLLPSRKSKRQTQNEVKLYPRALTVAHSLPFALLLLLQSQSYSWILRHSVSFTSFIFLVSLA